MGIGELHGKSLDEIEVDLEGKPSLSCSLFTCGIFHRYTEYLPCDTCFGFYYKADLCKHRKKCPEREFGKPIPASVQSDASMLLHSGTTASASLKRILATMHVDDISRCVKGDELPQLFGNNLRRKLRKQGDQQHHISNKLGELGRMVLEVRKCCSDVTTLKDCLIPSRFDFLIEAAAELSGWDDDEGKLLYPSIGIKLGHSLRKCTIILKRVALTSGDRGLIRKVEQLGEFIRDNWNDEISRIARDELYQRKWNKPLRLPLTSELQVLSTHLKDCISKNVSELAENNQNMSAWRNLATSVLTTAILFNRRRVQLLMKK